MLVANKYQAQKSIGGHPIKVQRAWAINSGQPVLLHKLDAASPTSSQALKLALQYAIAHPGEDPLLDVVDDSGSTYIVTGDRPECIALLDWLPVAILRSPADAKHFNHFDEQRDDGRESGIGNLPDRELVSSTNPLGEFTRIFRPGMAGSSGQSAAPEELGRRSADLFNTVARPAPGFAPVVQSEFTQRFFPQVNPPDPLASAGDDLPHGKSALPAEPLLNPKDQPGEYTRLFRSHAASGSEFPQPATNREVPLGEMQPQDPSNLVNKGGSFATRIQRDPAPAVAGPSDFTLVIRGGGSGKPLSDIVKPPQHPSPSPSPEVAFKLPVPAVTPPELKLPQPALPKTPEGFAAPLSADRGHRVPALLIILSLLLLGALATIVIFLLRR